MSADVEIQALTKKDQHFLLSDIVISEVLNWQLEGIKDPEEYVQEKLNKARQHYAKVKSEYFSGVIGFLRRIKSRNGEIPTSGGCLPRGFFSRGDPFGIRLFEDDIRDWLFNKQQVGILRSTENVLRAEDLIACGSETLEVCDLRCYEEGPFRGFWNSSYVHAIRRIDERAKEISAHFIELRVGGTYYEKFSPLSREKPMNSISANFYAKK